MPHKIQLRFDFITTLLRPVVTSMAMGLSVCSVGCSSLIAKDPPRLSTHPEKIFVAPFESVWKATQFTVKYPIAVNNLESGLLETEWVKSTDGFQGPTNEPDPNGGLRYKIIVQGLKGQIDGLPSVKLLVRKRVERLRNFFSDPESVDSDGLEERVILYRIERELAIEEGLKKALTEQ